MLGFVSFMGNVVYIQETRWNVLITIFIYIDTR